MCGQNEGHAEHKQRRLASRRSGLRTSPSCCYCWAPGAGSPQSEAQRARACSGSLARASPWEVVPEGRAAPRWRRHSPLAARAAASEQRQGAQSSLSSYSSSSSAARPHREGGDEQVRTLQIGRAAALQRQVAQLANAPTIPAAGCGSPHGRQAASAAPTCVLKLDLLIFAALLMLLMARVCVAAQAEPSRSGCVRHVHPGSLSQPTSLATWHAPKQPGGASTHTRWQAGRQADRPSRMRQAGSAHIRHCHTCSTTHPRPRHHPVRRRTPCPHPPPAPAAGTETEHTESGSVGYMWPGCKMLNCVKSHRPLQCRRQCVSLHITASTVIMAAATFARR